MKYICEICNKQYDTAAEAEKRELKHKKENVEKSAKTSASAKISDAVNAYVAKYKELPNINIASENQKNIIGDLADGLEKIFGMLIDVL